MPTLEELNGKRQELAREMRKMGEAHHANGGEWQDGEAQKAWDKANADYDEVMDQIERANADQAVQARLQSLADDDSRPRNPLNIGLPDQTPAGSPQERRQAAENDRSMAMAAWFQTRLGLNVAEDNSEAARRVGLPLHANELRLALPSTERLNALRAAWLRTPARDREYFAETYNAPLTTTTGTSGGNIIPPETMLRQLEVNMLAFGGVRQVAQQILTSSGEPMSWPTADDTGNSGRQLAESTPADDNAGGGSSGDGGPNPTFGKVVWNAYKFTSDTIKVPHELLEDAAFDLPVVLGAMLGERLGRITNLLATTGSGSGTFEGIVTGATLGITAASATAITADEVIQLEHSVNSAYRNGAGYMLNDDTLLALRLLKDNEGRYLWQSGFNGGAPDTLNNRPYTINHDMASAATGTFPLLFGQMSKYKIRRINQLRLYRLQERYRENDQDGFVAFVREDGGLLSAGTPPVKKLQMA
ncbi:MAG: phage major capsid protein [Planctomycetota bacterium]